MKWKRARRPGLTTAWQAATKKGRAKPRKIEEPIHITCLGWLRLFFMGMIFHTPNGADMGSEVIFINGKPVPRAAIMWKKLEKLGARAGVLDLTLHWAGGHTAYIEIKAPDGPYSPGQIDFMAELDKCGIPHRTVHSLEELIVAARELGLPLKPYPGYNPPV